MTISRKTLHCLRLTALVLFWPGVAAVIAGSLAATDLLPVRIDIDHRDLVLHFAGYATLAVMAAMGLRRRRSALWAAACLVLLGIALEFLQSYTGRDRSLYDALANAAGVAAGCFLGRAIVETFYRRYDSGGN